MSLGYNSRLCFISEKVPMQLQTSSGHLFSALGLVLKPNPESDSEDSEPDGPDDPVIPSPEMDDVKGEVFGKLIKENKNVIQHPMI